MITTSIAIANRIRENERNWDIHQMEAYQQGLKDAQETYSEIIHHLECRIMTILKGLADVKDAYIEDSETFVGNGITALEEMQEAESERMAAAARQSSASNVDGWCYNLITGKAYSEGAWR